MNWSKLVMLVSILSLFSGPSVFGENEIENKEAAITHAYLVANANVRIEQEQIELLNGVPVSIGIGSDGKGYFAVDLFPNFSAADVEAIGQIGQTIVMVTKGGEAFQLTYDAATAAYGTRSLGGGGVKVANKDKNKVLITPSLAQQGNAPAPKERVVRNPDYSYQSYCSGSSTYREGAQLARAHELYRSARSEDGTIHRDRLASAQELYVRASSMSLEANFFAAQTYALGEGKKDNGKALELYRVVIDAGSRAGDLAASAKYASALLLLEGRDGVTQDPEKALQLLGQVASLNRTSVSTRMLVKELLARRQSEKADFARIALSGKE